MAEKVDVFLVAIVSLRGSDGEQRRGICDEALARNVRASQRVGRA